MKAIVQRVTSASVEINAERVAAVGKGLLVLLGVERGDTSEQANIMADKILNLRIFNDENDKMNLSLLDFGGEMLVVSQFTLCADCHKGRRPSFATAAPPVIAQVIYNDFVSASKSSGVKVGTGEFGAHMDVSLVNDGPVTILLDTRDL